MTHEDFCVWLKGFLDMESCDGAIPVITPEQADMIEKHLNLVFKHDEYLQNQSVKITKTTRPDRLPPPATYRC